MDDKEKHAKRIQQKRNHINKQLNLAKTFDKNIRAITKHQPGRLAKVTWCDCGNPDCFMCGNPRKFFGEVTIQEKKFLEIEKDSTKELYTGEYE